MVLAFVQLFVFGLFALFCFVLPGWVYVCIIKLLVSAIYEVSTWLKRLSKLIQPLIGYVVWKEYIEMFHFVCLSVHVVFSSFCIYVIQWLSFF